MISSQFRDDVGHFVIRKYIKNLLCECFCFFFCHFACILCGFITHKKHIEVLFCRIQFIINCIVNNILVLGDELYGLFYSSTLLITLSTSTNHDIGHFVMIMNPSRTGLVISIHTRTRALCFCYVNWHIWSCSRAIFF